MGAFTVFGMSRSHCRKTAERTVSPHKVNITQWAELVAAEADRLFEASTKQVRIAPELDAPQFCRDWIAAQPNEVKHTKIMCRGDKIDKHGAVVMRDGAAVQTWLDYDEHKPVTIKPNPPQFPFVQEVTA